LIKCNFKNGRKNGLYEEFYENGELRESSNYKNGFLVKDEDWRDAHARGWAELFLMVGQ
jgi:antitoxin component YwqK of YwqJK toxin-antitoxin module